MLKSRQHKDHLVVYWNNLPAPYMVDRFNALARSGKLHFEAWFSDRTAADRSWSVDESDWEFSYRYVPAISVFNVKFHFGFVLLAVRWPRMLVSLYARPSFIAGWFVARLLGIKTAFRVLVTFDSWVKRSWLKEGVKHYMFRRVDAIETPGADGAMYAKRYGAPEKKIFIATHTVRIEDLTSNWKQEYEKRDMSRTALCLRGFVYLYVGRVWKGKGVFTLVEAFAMCQKVSTRQVSLLIVGDGTDEDLLREYCKERGIHNVIFSGFQESTALARCYAVADALVFPTLGDPYGLVVDEAMACRLPVVATLAAGEIKARVRDGVNGFLVAPGDADALAEAMIKVGQDVRVAREMGDASWGLIEGHTPERWAKDFEDMVAAVLSDR